MKYGFENEAIKHDGRFDDVEPKLKPSRSLTINGYRVEEWTDDHGRSFVYVNDRQVVGEYMEAIRKISAFVQARAR